MVHTCICTGNTLYNVAPKSERASDFQTEPFLLFQQVLEHYLEKGRNMLL